MELCEAIATRRSIRKYKNTQIKKEVIMEILEAGNLAPSATNRQPWEFVVFNRRCIDSLENILKESFHERVIDADEHKMRVAIKDMTIPEDGSGDQLRSLGWFYRTLGGAPIAIGVCLPRVNDEWIWKNFLLDSAAVIENILLAAWEKGIGTCWLTGPLKTKAKEIALILNIPVHLELISIISLGYPDHKPIRPPKKKVIDKTRWIGFD